MNSPFNEKEEIERNYLELQEKIDALDEESIEKRSLRNYFISKTELKEKIRFERQQKELCEPLKEFDNGEVLLKSYPRYALIDFTVVSFRKMFMNGELEKAAKNLVEDDRQVSFYLQGKEKELRRRVAFLSADEESGRIDYEIGIYGKIDEKKMKPLYVNSYEVSTDFRCKKGEGVKVMHGKRDLIFIFDGSECEGSARCKKKDGLLSDLDREDRLIIARVVSYKKHLAKVEVRVYEDPYLINE